MSRNAVSDINPKAKPADEELAEEQLGGLPGELVPTDKVEDVLETLDLPAAVEGEMPNQPVEELEPAPEEDERETIEESLSPEDPVRLYLREIGRISLLTAEREVELGRQMEVGQEKVRRSIMAVPLVRRELVALSDRLRKRDVESDTFLEAPDGTELTEPEYRRVMVLFGQIRKLDRQLEELEAARDRARKEESKRSIQDLISDNHRARVRLLGDLPLKPMVVDRWVARVRSLAQEMVGLGRQIEEAPAANRVALRKRLRELETQVGLPSKRLVALFRDVKKKKSKVRTKKKTETRGKQKVGEEEKR
jgi:RNA polymerase primary sigma factor